MTEITPEALEALSKKATQGVWSYRPDEYDGWGIVRGEEQDMGWEWKPRPIIAQFCGGQDEAELSKHRKAKTDPWKDDPLFVCALVNAYRTGQLILAQPSGDEVEAVAINLVNRQRMFEGYEPLKDLTPLDNEDQEFWRNEATAAITALDAVRGKPARKFSLGDRVTKTKGSSWTGLVVGFYSTSLTPIGYAVESENEPGSVQIYPESALEACLKARENSDG